MVGEKEHFSWKKKRVSLVEKNVWITERFFDNHYKRALFKIENLVLWARSEMIGSGIDQICSWFQVSVNTEYWNLNADLVATECQPRWKKFHFVNDSDTAGRIWLLTPDTWTLLVNVDTHITPPGWTKAGPYGPGSLHYRGYGFSETRCSGS